MATRASATDMIPLGGEDEPLLHGGDLGAARRLFPGAPEPFLDLSTGINPKPYPVPRFSAGLFARLPDTAAVAALAAAAARAYAAPSAAHVVPAPGTQILLPLVARLVPPGRAAILAPTYPEYARAAALAGHGVKTVRSLDEYGDATLVMVANPNNPDGRLLARADLLALARDLGRRGGLLVVDEAFMDVGPPGASLAPDVAQAAMSSCCARSANSSDSPDCGWVLRLPLRRLPSGFAPRSVRGRYRVRRSQLARRHWPTRTGSSGREFGLIRRRGGWMAFFPIWLFLLSGGTSLFRLVRTPAAGALFQHLGQAGIWVRRFPDNENWLRFGLPAGEPQWKRLKNALFPSGNR